MTVTDDDMRTMQAEIVALAEAWLDRGLPPEAIAGVLSVQGNLYMLEVGTRLDPLLAALTEMWNAKGGKQ